MQLIFDVASGLTGLGGSPDLWSVHSARRRSDFEIKAIKYLRSYHPKTKYPLAWRRFYDAAFIRVYADKCVINTANLLARACIIPARGLAVYTDRLSLSFP